MTAPDLATIQRRQKAARENGRQGGLQRALRHSPKFLSQWGALGGQAVLRKDGPDYFVRLRKRRKNYPKYGESIPVHQTSPRVLAGKRNGQRGGFARAKLYGREERTEWARKGGIATRDRYGSKFYGEIRKLRKRYRSGYFTRKTWARVRAQADEAMRNVVKKFW